MPQWRRNILITVIVSFVVLGHFRLADVSAQADVLPAPLYFIDHTNLIVRLETDGVTQTQVVLDTQPIDSFDMSPVDGRLAYVVGNNLVLADVDGSNPTVLFEGGPLTVDEGGYPTIDALVYNRVSNPVWSPDGTKIAFGYGGIYLYDFAGESAVSIVTNEVPEDVPDGEPPYGSKIFTPKSWAPDGSGLMLYFNWVPEGGGWAYYELTGMEYPQELIRPDGYGFCCGYQIWSADGSMLIHGSANAIYPGEAGLWSIDITDLRPTSLGDNFMSVMSASTVAEFSHPHLLDDGILYFFHQTFDFENPEQSGLMPYRAQLDGTDFEALRPNDTSSGYAVGEALWAPDGSGIVMNAFNLEYESPAPELNGTGFPIFWLPMGAGEPVFLALGKNFRWGQ